MLIFQGWIDFGAHVLCHVDKKSVKKYQKENISLSSSHSASRCTLYSTLYCQVTLIVMICCSQGHSKLLTSFILYMLWPLARLPPFLFLLEEKIVALALMVRTGCVSCTLAVDNLLCPCEECQQLEIWKHLNQNPKYSWICNRECFFLLAVYLFPMHYESRQCIAM